MCPKSEAKLSKNGSNPLKLKQSTRRKSKDFGVHNNRTAGEVAGSQGAEWIDMALYSKAHMEKMPKLPGFDRYYNYKL